MTSINCIWLDVGSFLAFLAQELTQKVIKMTEDQLFAIIAMTVALSVKGRTSLEKYWYYFHCPKNVLCSILSFVFWIFPLLNTAVQLESADSKQNTISKSAPMNQCIISCASYSLKKSDLEDRGLVGLTSHGATGLLNRLNKQMISKV